jgi:hypothetical protein
MTQPYRASQDAYDALDDFERAELDKEIRAAQDKLASEWSAKLDRMMLGALGIPAELPPDSQHYTPDLSARVIDAAFEIVGS